MITPSFYGVHIQFGKVIIYSQDWQPEFLIYGDLGVHSNSTYHLIQEVLSGRYTAVLHVGDFGYNLEQTIDYGPHAGQNVGGY